MGPECLFPDSFDPVSPHGTLQFSVNTYTKPVIFQIIAGIDKSEAVVWHPFSLSIHLVEFPFFFEQMVTGKLVGVKRVHPMPTVVYGPLPFCGL